MCTFSRPCVAGPDDPLGLARHHQEPTRVQQRHRHQLNGYLDQRVPSLSLASKSKKCLNHSPLKGMFPRRARYPLGCRYPLSRRRRQQSRTPGSHRANSAKSGRRPPDFLNAETFNILEHIQHLARRAPGITSDLVLCFVPEHRLYVIFLKFGVYVITRHASTPAEDVTERQPGPGCRRRLAVRLAPDLASCHAFLRARRAPAARVECMIGCR